MAEIMSISRITRRIVLPVFRKVNVGDLTIRHHWTRDPLRLHSFKHKGYWWYGRARERESMELFAKLIPRGRPVIEIGGHIGYISQYFAMLTGPEGRVYCFEPSPENLPYLKANAARCAHRNISVIEAAASDRDGACSFYFESVTGQNSTTLRDFDGLENNSSYNGLPTDYQECTVTMRSVDSFLAEHAILPGFIKIDAEGAEKDILRGMERALKSGTRLMVEVTMNREPVFQALQDAGYTMYDALRKRVLSPGSDAFSGNIFAIHADDTAGLAIMEDQSGI